MTRVLALRLVVVAVVVGTAAACARPLPPGDSISPPSIAASRTSPAAPADPTCPPTGVRIQISSMDAAAGLRVIGFDLVDCGRASYRVDGYPVARALDAQRKPLDVRVLHGVDQIIGPVPDWSGPPRPVTLRPGQRATAVVAWRSTYDDIRHPPVNAPFLAVTPPAGGAAQILAPEGGFDLGSTGRLGVSPWRPAKSPPSTAPAPGPAATTQPAPATPPGSQAPIPPSDL